MKLVAGPRMRHHAAEFDATVVQNAPDFQQRILYRRDPGTMPVRVDLAPDFKRFRALGAKLRDFCCCGCVIDYQLQVAALLSERHRSWELRRRDTDRIKNIGHTSRKECFR